MTNVRPQTYNPRPIEQGQDSILLFTFSNSITGYGAKMYILSRPDKAVVKSYAVTIDEAAKTIKGKLTKAETATIPQGTYDWEFWITDSAGEEFPLLTGLIIVNNGVKVNV